MSVWYLNLSCDLRLRSGRFAASFPRRVYAVSRFVRGSERQTLLLLLLTLMMLPDFTLLLVLVPALLGLDPLQDVVVVGQSVAAVVKRAQKRGIPAWIKL